MLTLLNLQVFDTIFETRAEHKLSSMSKSLYINCLFGYFKGKEVNEKNSIAFEIFINDIKNYSKWQKNFQELHKAKLIKIENDRINFINHWGQFIERAKLSTEKLFVKTDVNSFYEQLINNKSLMDLIKSTEKELKEWEDRENTSFHSRPTFAPVYTQKEIDVLKSKLETIGGYEKPTSIQKINNYEDFDDEGN
jgi:hypothetical protein